MNAPARIPLARDLRSGATPDILAEIAAPGVSMAIWRRRLPSGFAAWIDALPPERLPQARLIAPVEQIEAAMQAACAQAGTPEGALRDWLARDAAALAQQIGRIAGQRRVELRLEVIADDKCRRFHVDNVRCRLLCAYRGPGAQYARAAPGADVQPADIRQLASGETALMRGALWPAGDAPGVLHRSPPIAGAGETRLLLVIDPAESNDA